MSSIIRDYIFQADAQGRYLDPAELERIKSFVNASERRLRAAQRLTDHREWIIIQAATLLFQKQPDIVSPDGNAYAEKMTASCLRDLDYYLRIVTYGIVAGDVSFLEEIGLIGIREMYSSLGTPLSAVAEGVFALRTVANSLISTEDANEAGVYFDYIINCIDGVSPTSQQAIKELFEQQTDHPLKQLQEKFKKLLNSFANTASEGLRTDCGFWEPSSYIEWLKLDKLAQQIQRNGVNDKASFEASAKAFFESWRCMPGLLRRTVWREREIMAALLERLSDWDKIAGFAHIGVAKKQFGDQEKLAGILTFKVFAGEYLYEKHNIPRFVKVESLLSQSQDDKLVPILLESVLLPIEYSSLVSQEAADIGFQSPCLQSGDVIVGRNSSGRFNEGQTVTLTTFVVSQDALEDVKPQVMSVRHGFKGGYTEINVYEAQLIIKVGQVFYKSPYQQEKAENLDISLINLEQSFELNPFLKWTEAFPGNPFPTWSGMLVQMYGGASGHVVGYVNHSMIMSSVAASSIVPSFTAIIPSQPGDSGSLLVAGNHSGDPLPDAEAKGLDSSQVEKLRFAMLGILVAGAPSGGSYTNLTYFTPMIDICQQLRIKPYLSMKSSIVKIEQPASISQSQ